MEKNRKKFQCNKHRKKVWWPSICRKTFHFQQNIKQRLIPSLSFFNRRSYTKLVDCWLSFDIQMLLISYILNMYYGLIGVLSIRSNQFLIPCEMRWRSSISIPNTDTVFFAIYFPNMIYGMWHMAHLKHVSIVVNDIGSIENFVFHFLFAVVRVNPDKVTSTFTTIFNIEHNVISLSTRALLLIVSYLMSSVLYANPYN